MSMITSKELGQVHDLSHLTHILPVLEQELALRRDRITRRALDMLEKKELTPEVALFFWMEILAVDGLWKSLDTKVRLGQAAGRKLAQGALTTAPINP